MDNNLPKRKFIRIKDYNYSQSGYYFITICTQNHRELFGNVIDDKMILNKYGKIVKKILFKLPERYKNIELDEYIIMPNHLHGIIVINNNEIQRRGRVSRPETNKLTWRIMGDPNGLGDPAPTAATTTMTLGQMIAYFKYQSTKQINVLFGNLPGTKLWQRNYYEHIIRNEDDLNKIREYIAYNPLNWQADRNNPENFNNN